MFGGALKLGAVEDQRNRDKLVQLTRFATNQRNSTSLDKVGFSLAILTWGTDLDHSTSRTRSKARSRSSTLLTWARPPSISLRACSSRSLTLADMRSSCSTSLWTRSVRIQGL